MRAPSAVLGTATVFCHPLRYLFDVESSVAVLSNGSSAEHILGYVHIHISISTSGKPDLNDQGGELAQFIGCFVRVRVRVQPDTRGPYMDACMRIQYQLSPATESFVFTVDHTNESRILVTDDLLTHISTTALQFNFLPPDIRNDPKHLIDIVAESAPSPTPPVEPALSVPLPLSVASKEDAEAARMASEAAALAAQIAADAAREAATAAKQAVDAATSSRIRGDEMDRADSKVREAAQERMRELEVESKLKSFTLEKQQFEHKLEMLSEEKQRISGDAARLARELEQKDAAMGKWQQQAASTDQAVELLKQRLASDAREREELQRRLRVLEEEKLELLKKSRACVVQ